MTDSRAGWMQDAADDIKSPSVGAIVRWAQRAARAKAEAGVADRTLQDVLSRRRDVCVARLAMPPGSLADAVEANMPIAEVMTAERALADAIEAEEFASRISRALEIRRTRIAADEAKPPLRTVQGGKR